MNIPGCTASHCPVGREVSESEVQVRVWGCLQVLIQVQVVWLVGLPMPLQACDFSFSKCACGLQLMCLLSSLLPLLMAWRDALGAFKTPSGWCLVALHPTAPEPETASHLHLSWSGGPPEAVFPAWKRPVGGLWVKGDGWDWMDQQQSGLGEVRVPRDCGVSFGMHWCPDIRRWHGTKGTQCGAQRLAYAETEHENQQWSQPLPLPISSSKKWLM